MKVTKIGPRLVEKARAHFKKVDPKLYQLVCRIDKELGKFGLKAKKEGSIFDHSVRSIVGQQLSTKAAETIYRRVCDLYGGKPTPEQILATEDEKLRGAGLSRQKLSYLKDLSAHVVEGRLPLDTLDELEDQLIVDALTQVKGIGVWTVQMVLIFRLGRADVLPALDLGIQKGIQRTYGMRTLPKPKKVAALGAKWGPYRTVASWYFWRSLDLPKN